MNSSTRRNFLRTLSAIGAASVLPRRLHAKEQTASPDHPGVDPSSQLKMGNETIVILIYPEFTAIDAVGPEYILSGMMGATVRFVAKSAQPVPCETGFDIVPNLTFEECPQNPDLLIVPGGTSGTLKAIEDPATRNFLKKTGAGASIVGSVCTGSLLLGAAGLLNGYKATSHWQTLELLPLFGAEPVDQRVVFDRNRITGAGVTAGLDFALTLVRHFRGDFYAKGMQLLSQYDPQPPFSGGGDHRTADPKLVDLLNEMHKPFVNSLAKSIRSVMPDVPGR